MSFFNESIKTLCINNSPNLLYCQVFPDKGITIDGYKKIIELSNSKIIILSEQSKKIEILGRDLLIKEISNRELNIAGTILTINFT